MDLTSQVALNNGLAFLAWATGIIILIAGGFLIKLLFDVSKLAKNLNQTTDIVNTELKPTIKELQNTLHSVNEIVKNTDQGVDNIKNALGKTLDKTKNISDSIFSGMIKGFTTVMRLFKKI